MALVLGVDFDIASEQNLPDLNYVSEALRMARYHNGVVHDFDTDGYAELLISEPYATTDSEKEGRCL